MHHSFHLSLFRSLSLLLLLSSVLACNTQQKSNKSKKDTVRTELLKKIGKKTSVKKVQPVIPDSVNYEIIGTMTTYTVKEGETLTRVSLRFYGTKTLWPYIVKHNLNVLKDPDNVISGTVLHIPKLAKKQ